jgi:hypothetical protein
MSDQLGIVNKPPYFDDFDPTKNYSKILFRPGRAIQSRELTQIQTILQNQISALGDKVLQTPVISGGDFQVGTVKYLKFYSASDPSFYVNKLVRVQSGNDISEFKVIQVQALDDDFSDTANNWAMFFEYTNGVEITDVLTTFSTTISTQSIAVTVIDQTALEQANYTIQIRGFTDATHNVYGDSLICRLGTGVFYKKGYFIVTDEPLLLVPSTQSIDGNLNYTNFAPASQSTKVALKLSESYITTEEDSTLYDPSAGYYNFAAPGADRLKITPSLIQPTDDDDTDTVDIATIEDGEVRIDPSAADTSNASVFSPDSDCQDRVLKPFYFDIIGSTLNVNGGRAVVNCTDIEIVENQEITIPQNGISRVLSNQALPEQCLADAVIVTSNNDSPLFGGVAGTDFTSVNTNYYGSGRVKKIFSDEAPRLELVNFDGVQIGCLTLLDIEENDSTSYRLYYNELESYVASIAVENLFNEAAFLYLDGEKVFTVESPVPLTCADTIPGGNRRLVYKAPASTNVRRLFDGDYFITRDFVSDISTTSNLPAEGSQARTLGGYVSTFTMDIPDGVFNDNSVASGNGVVAGDPDLFIVVVNGKRVPLNNVVGVAPYVLVESRTRVQVVLAQQLDSDSAISSTSPEGTALTMPSAGRCYLIAKVRFPESGTTRPTLPHRKKRLREARGTFVQNLATNPTISLGFSDVYKLISVAQSDGTDITSAFVFDNGQRNDRYDHATITIDPNRTVENTDQEFVVTFQYFYHEPIAPGFYGPITVNSYGFDKDGNAISGFHGKALDGSQLTLSYDEIPNFLDRVSGEVLSLGDCIDFRLYRTEEGLIENGVSKSSIIRARWFPSPDISAAPEIGYSVSEPRIDLAVLRQDGSIVLVKGEQSESPVAREYPKDGCVIAEIKIPGFVSSSEDYIISKTPIKTITLPELNDMQNRISELEKALSLKTLENKAKIQSAVLNNEYLTGMVVDDFGGHYVGDVANDEYNCSIDFSNGTLNLPFTTKFVDFIPLNGYPTGEDLSSYFITAPLASTEGVTLFSNEQATTELTVNGFGVADWHGYLQIDRPTQLWIDQNTKPVVRNNHRGQNDAWEAGGECVQPDGRKNGFGTQWKFWRSVWFGDSIFEEKVAEKDRASSKKFSDSITNNASDRFIRSVNREELFSPSKKTIGAGGFAITDPKSSRYVDSSLNFFVPSDYIIVRGYSLKPNTTYSVYFDNMTTPVLASRLYSIAGTTLSSVVTDSEGYVEFVLSIPQGSYISGNKVVKLVETGSSTKPSFASAIYYNIGSDWKNKTPETDDSVDVEFYPLGRTDIVIKNQKTFYPQVNSINGLYQTFFIDSKDYPEGTILKNLSLYFTAVDTSAPVSIELRRVVDGSIDYNNIITNSRVELVPAATGTTVFTFTLPVYLAPGEYALFVRTNSTNYKVHVSQKGVARIDNGVSDADTEVYASGIYGAGRFFSGSAFTQQGDSATTLRFSVKRQSYNTALTQSSSLKPREAFNATFGGQFTETTTNYIYFANNNWQTTNGTVGYRFGTTLSIPTNTDIALNETVSRNSRVFVDVATSREDVSPIVDTRKLGMLCIKNQVSQASEITEPLELASFAGEAGSKMKYITRRTDLAIPANILRATVEAKIPGDFDTAFYAKVLYEGDQDFDNQPYVKMVPVFGAASTTKDGFRELVFEYDGTNAAKPFISFAVKCLLTKNSTAASTTYPQMRNLTVVSSVR